MSDVEEQIVKALGLDPEKFNRTGLLVRQTSLETTVEVTFSRTLEPQEAALVNDIVRRGGMERWGWEE